MKMQRPSRILAFLFILCLSLPQTRTAHADIAVIVHPDNPVSSLSEDEVRQIFLGRMRLYPATQKNIDPIDQDASNVAYNRFYRIVANLTPTVLQRLRAMYLFSGKGLLPKKLANEDAVVEFVAQHPEAIGYIRQEKMNDRVKSVLLIKDK